jgi:hypothetical protein
MSKKTFLILNLSMCLLLGGCSTRTFKEHEALCDTNRRDNSGFVDYFGCTHEDADLDNVPNNRDLCPNSPSSVCSGSGLNEIERE